jgi:ferric-dicitrate binding protein FerR (iron transport regulator)
MTTKDQFLKYAEECRRIARSTPEHAKALRQIAEAWESCAHEAENASERDGGGGKSA